MRQRILLPGCHGRLGQHLLRLLLPDCEVLGLDLQPESFVAHPHFRYIRLQGVGRNSLKGLFKDFQPDAVLNAAAFTAVDRAEEQREACWRANVDLVRSLLELCRPRGVWLGQVSTDYVFDGSEGPYDEQRRPAPLNVYGQSKLASENLVRGAELPAAIVRTIVVYGKGHGLAPDFFSWLDGELRAGREVRIVNDQTGNCIWAMELARVLVRAMERRASGLYHAAAPEILSRHEMALVFADELGLDAELIHPVATAQLGQAAERPLRSGLSCEKSCRELGLTLLGFRESLRAWRADRPELWSIN